MGWSKAPAPRAGSRPDAARKAATMTDAAPASRNWMRENVMRMVARRPVRRGHPPAGSRGNWRVFFCAIRSLAVDLPRYAETIDHLAKTRSPEGLFKRHHDPPL